MSFFWRTFVSGLQQRCPICLQKIPDEDMRNMKGISKTSGIITCKDCWLAHNYSLYRVADLRDFYHGRIDEFVLHPHKPDSLVFRKGEKLQGDPEKIFRNLINFAERYSKNKL